MENNDKKIIKVYYNSACPLCRAGINHQKAKMISCRVDWNDVHTQPGVHNEVSPDLEFVRKKIHAIDEKGEIKVGIEAFEVIWRNSPSEHWKAKVISFPGIKQISIFLYNIFSWFLYKWNIWRNHW
jgi:predicted DCC family thiol-disulfide oxidoreductase YuxK